jgi:hypothetical protein
MRLAGSRALACLALAAMLLLALVPAIGRLAASAPGARVLAHAVAPTRAAMPSHSIHARHGGHAASAEVLPSQTRILPGKAPAPDGHGGHDCPYCPLLSGLATAITVPWMPRAPLRLAPWSIRVAASRPQEAPVPALGGQGPPAHPHA